MRSDSWIGSGSGLPCGKFRGTWDIRWACHRSSTASNSRSFLHSAWIHWVDQNASQDTKKRRYWHLLLLMSSNQFIFHDIRKKFLLKIYSRKQTNNALFTEKKKDKILGEGFGNKFFLFIFHLIVVRKLPFWLREKNFFQQKNLFSAFLPFARDNFSWISWKIRKKVME